MNISVELQLLALVLVLYLQDTLLLLCVNEGVLCHIKKNKWQVWLGSDNARFFGKELLTSHLFFLTRPIFKLSWSPLGRSNLKNNETYWLQKVAQLNTFRPYVYLIATVQFIFFPIVLLFYLTDFAIVAVLLLLYVSIFMLLLKLAFARKKLNLSNKKFISICFESLICPPVSVNLIRKLSLEIKSNVDLLCLAPLLLTPEQWEKTRPEFLRRLEDAMLLEEEGSVNFNLMMTYHQQLLGKSTQ